MRSKRRHAWVGFALCAALAIVGLFVVDGAGAGAILLGAMLTFIVACIYALRGAQANVAGDKRPGVIGWLGNWF